MNRIYTFGDGFATGHIWPEWPQILAALLPESKIINFAGIGAGNEYIFSNCLEAYRQDPTAMFFVQWAQPQRFDKLLQDDAWHSVIHSDLDYYDNLKTEFNRTWWLSSASVQQDVKLYHEFYIQTKQANLRSFNYIYSLGKILKNHCFFGTQDFNYLTLEQKNQCLDFNWAWFIPWYGQQRYALASEFDQIRQTNSQPVPYIHLKWLVNMVLPKTTLSIDPKRIDRLTNILYTTTWPAHDPNNAQQWNQIRNEL